MSNNDLIRRFYQEEDRRKGPPAEYFADGFTAHFAGGPPMDFRGFEPLASAFRAGFPDLRHELGDLVGEDDKVAVRLTLRGTHKGEFMGIPPTGKQIAVAVIAIYRIEGDKIAESWIVPDQMGLMQQIGAISAPNQ